MPRVSIIVPVYNVSKYLRRCLDSLINQTLNDIEIIIVNDGSTDNSFNICQQYANIDKRIVLINKENGGLSSARNEGLKYVTSRYVAFVDSDDYVDRNMYLTLYSKLQENNLDTVFCGYYKQNKLGEFIKCQETAGYKCYSDKSDINKFLMNMIGSEPSYEHTAKYFMTVWRALYSMDIIKRNKILFKNYISEDVIFHFDYLINSARVGIIPNCFYYYCLNQESLSCTYKKDRFIKDCIVYKSLQELIKKQNMTDYNIFLDKYLLMRARIDICAIFNHAFGLSEIRKNINEIISSSELQVILNTYPYTQLHLKQKAFFLLLKYKCLYILIAILKIIC